MSIHKNVLNYVETPDGIKKIEENVNDILARKDNRYKGWRCWTGIHMIAIFPDGSLYNSSCKNKKMGNIYDDGKVELAKTPHICKREWCVCAADINVRKIKDDKYRNHVRRDSVS